MDFEGKQFSPKYGLAKKAVLIRNILWNWPIQSMVSKLGWHQQACGQKKVGQRLKRWWVWVHSVSGPWVHISTKNTQAGAGAHLSQKDIGKEIWAALVFVLHSDTPAPRKHNGGSQSHAIKVSKFGFPLTFPELEVSDSETCTFDWGVTLEIQVYTDGVWFRIFFPLRRSKVEAVSRGC